LVSFSGVALAVPVAENPPAWWDDPDTNPTWKKLQSSNLTTNDGGTGGSIDGHLYAELENEEDRTKEKFVFLVVDMVTDSTEVAFESTGKISWSYGDGGAGAGVMTMVSDNDPNDDHYEYEFGPIFPQPQIETVAFKFTDLDVATFIKIEFDIRSICYEDDYIPEPAGLGLIGLALLAVRRKRS
jgi:hypothetical protein